MPIPAPRSSEPAATAPGELVAAALPIVGYLAAEFAHRLPSHVELDDLRSAGFLALVQAARSYDAARGVPFKRFAQLRVRGAMLDELRSQDWATRSVRAKARQVETVEDELAAAFGRQPTRAELAERLGVPPATLTDLDEDLHRSTVLSLHGFDGGTPVEDRILGYEPSPESVLMSRERTAYLVDAVASLPGRLGRIVTGLYYEDRPLADLATELGVTESRISQMRTQALGMLRDGLTTALDGSAPIFDRPDGCVARRRTSYLAAVRQRSTFRERVSAKTVAVH